MDKSKGILVLLKKQRQHNSVKSTTVIDIMDVLKKIQTVRTTMEKDTSYLEYLETVFDSQSLNECSVEFMSYSDFINS